MNALADACRRLTALSSRAVVFVAMFAAPVAAADTLTALTRQGASSLRIPLGGAAGGAGQITR